VQQNTNVGPSDRALNYLFIGELILTAMVFFLIFSFNWEDRFFGMKLDGTIAGMFLFLKGIVAVLLLCIILIHPHKIRLAAILATLYYSYLFIDSSVTTQTATGEWYLFAFPFVLLILVQALLLVPRNRNSEGGGAGAE